MQILLSRRYCRLMGDNLCQISGSSTSKTRVKERNVFTIGCAGKPGHWAENMLRNLSAERWRGCSRSIEFVVARMAFRMEAAEASSLLSLVSRAPDFGIFQSRNFPFGNRI